MDYRDDPEWIAAREKYARDCSDDETATRALSRRLAALHVMRAVEDRYEEVSR